MTAPSQRLADYSLDSLSDGTKKFGWLPLMQFGDLYGVGDTIL